MNGVGFIKGKSSDRIKIYLVVGLGLVLAALVYRHLKAKPSPNASLSPADIPAMLAEVPELPLLDTGSLPETQPAKPKVKEPRRSSVRDIFAPTRPWKKTVRKATRKPRTRSQKHPPFKLKGVIMGGGNSVAIINGKLLRLGERIDGYQLVRIEEKEVFLRSGNRTVKLKLAKQ